MMPSVSIVLSCYNRAKQLQNTLDSIHVQNYESLEVIVVEDGDDGKTKYVAQRAGARYYSKTRTDLPHFHNPARLHNIGIRRATGDIVILQGGEVMYDTPQGILGMVRPIVVDPKCSTFALVKSLTQDGKFYEWYSHPREGSRAGWKINFCQAVRRGVLLDIGGFDESFAGYGGEDTDFEERLQLAGIRLQYAEDVLCSHQWHARPNYGSVDFVGGRRDGYRTNVGVEWGRL